MTSMDAIEIRHHDRFMNLSVYLLLIFPLAFRMSFSNLLLSFPSCLHSTQTPYHTLRTLAVSPPSMKIVNTKPTCRSRSRFGIHSYSRLRL